MLSLSATQDKDGKTKTYVSLPPTPDFEMEHMADRLNEFVDEEARRQAEHDKGITFALKLPDLNHTPLNEQEIRERDAAVKELKDLFVEHEYRLSPQDLENLITYDQNGRVEGIPYIRGYPVNGFNQWLNAKATGFAESMKPNIMQAGSLNILDKMVPLDICPVAGHWRDFKPDPKLMKEMARYV